MKFALSFLTLTACAAAVANADPAHSAQDVASSSDVLSLTKDSFDAEIKDAKLALVEFYAPWCGHCKALAPAYEIAATALKEKDIKLAKVDCVDEEKFCEENGIRGFPTLKVYREGEATDYTGPRDADGIASFMTKQSLPALTDLTAETFEEFKESDKVVIVGFLDKAGSVAHKALEAVANQLRNDFVFGSIVDSAIAKQFNVTAPGLVLFKKFDEGINVLDKATKITSEAVTSFIRKFSVPLVDEIGPHNYEKYVESGIPLAYLFVGSDEHRDTHVPKIKEIAEEFKGKVNFVHIDAVKFGSHGKNLNLKDEYPAFAIQDNEARTKFPFDQEKELTTENLRAFVQDVIDGKEEPSIKSEPIPETNDGPVKVVVAKNFDALVKDTTKDVLVEFYAPWCGHCKKLAPTYEVLGGLFPEESNVVVAKMDATENDIPPKAGFEVQGFPTLKLFRAETNEIVDYNGDRSLEDLKKFLTTESKSKFEPKETEEHSAGHDEL